MGRAILEGTVRGGLSKEVTLVETPMMGGSVPRPSLGWEVSGRYFALMGFLFWWESQM